MDEYQIQMYSVGTMTGGELRSTMRKLEKKLKTLEPDSDAARAVRLKIAMLQIELDVRGRDRQ